jgi:hypothetical protein
MVLRQTGWVARGGVLLGLAAAVAARVILTTYGVVRPWTRRAAMGLLRR